MSIIGLYYLYINIMSKIPIKIWKIKYWEEAMLIDIINSPSKGTIRLLSRKVSDSIVKDLLSKENINAVGLVQGQVEEIILAADIAEKASSVEVAEIHGSCPQHITLLGIFGDTSSVKTAITAVHKWQKERNIKNT